MKITVIVVVMTASDQENITVHGNDDAIKVNTPLRNFFLFHCMK